MRTRDAIGFIILACFAAACGSSSTPIGPTPAATTWTLSGTISSSVGGGINGATVAIIDGPDSGKQMITDAADRYSFAGLQQAGFTIKASANGYTSVSRGITLTADTISDSQLPRLPAAALTFEGALGFDARPDGGWDMHATGVNTGDGCAASISGTTTLTGAVVFTYPWTLPASLVVRPGQRFQYTFGPISRGDADAVGNGGTYVTRFTFTTTACP